MTLLHTDRWLVKRRRHTEALVILTRINGGSSSSNKDSPESLSQELDNLENSTADSEGVTTESDKVTATSCRSQLKDLYRLRYRYVMVKDSLGTSY